MSSHHTKRSAVDELSERVLVLFLSQLSYILRSFLTSLALPSLSRQLDLHNYRRVTTEEARRFGGSLNLCDGLRGLYLDCASLGRVRLVAMFGQLTQGALPQLRVLNMSGNRFGDEGLAAFAAAVSVRSALPMLEWLNLDECCIGNVGFTALASAFRLGGLPNLSNLTFTCTWVDDEGIKTFADAVRERPLQRLERLYLCFNSLVTAAGKHTLASALAAGALPALKLLFVGGAQDGYGENPINLRLTSPSLGLVDVISIEYVRS